MSIEWISVIGSIFVGVCGLMLAAWNQWISLQDRRATYRDVLYKERFTLSYNLLQAVFDLKWATLNAAGWQAHCDSLVQAGDQQALAECSDLRNQAWMELQAAQNRVGQCVTQGGLVFSGEVLDTLMVVARDFALAWEGDQLSEERARRSGTALDDSIANLTESLRSMLGVDRVSAETLNLLLATPKFKR